MSMLASILVLIGYIVLGIGVILFIMTSVKKLVDNEASRIKIFDIEIALPATLVLAVFGGLLAVSGTFGPTFFENYQISNGDSPQPTAPAAPTTATGAAELTASAEPARGPSADPGLAVVASASCVSPSSRDAGGATVTYGPEKAFDGLLDTAWRCDGDGVDQRLEINFSSRVTLTNIGMVPGYAKTDPSDGTDRYAQNRRISEVRYAFDDGNGVSQRFDTSAFNRSIQTLALPNVSTSHVTITILSSVNGEANGGQQPRDNIAISEVAVSMR